jgi:hypothetical protein
MRANRIFSQRGYLSSFRFRHSKTDLFNQGYGLELYVAKSTLSKKKFSRKISERPFDMNCIRFIALDDFQKIIIEIHIGTAIERTRRLYEAKPEDFKNKAIDACLLKFTADFLRYTHH